jgi:RNA polymerase sigma-70 factor, ECF subfamily
MDGQDLTQLLAQARNGNRAAEDELFQVVYGELRKLASHALRSEKSGHTLQPTALVHEAYLRLLGSKSLAWNDRGHFFTAASRTMRRVLIDHARRHLAEKGGGGFRRLDLDERLQYVEEDSPAVVLLHDCLESLAARDPRQATIVELRFFGGLTEEEIALVLDVSSRTVKRDWVTARAWLQAEMVARG